MNEDLEQEIADAFHNLTAQQKEKIKISTETHHEFEYNGETYTIIANDDSDYLEIL